MRTAFTKIIIATGLVLGAMLASADGLGPGSPPPALDVKTWYKGAPVTEFNKDQTYVVEFWATWCGPCIQSIPHLTELAKKNTDVTFIGVSIWEDDKDNNVKNFIDKMGEKMDYHVGYSGNKTGMSESWMMAAGQNGIPTAFVIKNNEVQWIGHPMELEKPLGEIKAGTFDRATFKKAFDTQAEANRAAMLIRKEQTAITKLIKDGKYDEAKVKIAEFEAKNPKIKMEAARFLLLSKQDPKGFNAKVDELSSKGDGQKSQILISFAMDQAQKGGNVDQGRTVIKALVKNAKKDDVMPHYYAALFYGETNEPKLALDAIEKAIAIYPTSNLKDNKQAKAAFDKMKDDFSAKVKAKSK